ncbi:MULTISPECIES: GGDEF domain-containing protein [Pseudomonas]|uniref:GGDEF domain-containing protein n=1 Tax=Pseudomonas TaxID=286 RepID=UPI00249C1140|nr:MULTISPECIES: GGDEF domain-containing protein [Pseudomonas]
MNGLELPKSVPGSRPTQAIPAELRSAFDDYVRQHCRSFLIAINLIAAAAYLSYAAVDAVIIPDVALLSLLMRVVLVAIGLCNIYLLFRFGQSILLMDLLLPLHTLICTAAWFELLKHSQSPDIPTFIYASIAFIVLCNMGARVSFGGALACSLAISAVILASVVQLSPDDSRAALVFLLVYLPVLCLSLFISWTSTRNVRQAFLADVEVRRQQAELSTLNQCLEQLAATDALTCVGNRRAFDQRLAESWTMQQAHGRGFALLLVDIDYFKAFNDHFGHQAGDQCLQEVARSMVETLRHGQAQTFRYGGEEFAILLQVSDAEELRSIAERLVDQVAELDIPHPHRPDAQERLTISVGVALSHDEGVQSPEDLVARCDRLLYLAKQLGRNQVCLAQA